MYINFKGKIVQKKNWKKSTEKKDITIQEEASGEQIILLCLDDKFPMLKKCPVGSDVKVYVKIKSEMFGSFLRTYLYLDHIALLKT
jgi:hypothetical protein